MIGYNVGPLSRIGNCNMSVRKMWSTSIPSVNLLECSFSAKSVILSNLPTFKSLQDSSNSEDSFTTQVLDETRWLLTIHPSPRPPIMPIPHRPSQWKQVAAAVLCASASKKLPSLLIVATTHAVSARPVLPARRTSSSRRPT